MKISAYINIGERSKIYVVGYIRNDKLFEQAFNSAVDAFICVIALKNMGILTSSKDLLGLESLASLENDAYWRDSTIYEAVYNSN